MFADGGKGTGAVGYFHGAGSRIAADVVGDVVLCTDVVTKAVVFGGFQGRRRFIFHVEGTGNDVLSAQDLAQGTVVDKDLFGIGRHFGQRRISGKGTNVAEVLEVAGDFPDAPFFLPIFAGYNPAAFQPHFTMRFSLQGDVVFGDEEVRFAIDTAFQDDGCAITSPGYGCLDGVEWFVTCSFPFGSPEIGILAWRDPQDVLCGDGVIGICCLVLMIQPGMRYL